jgi:predicted permease
LRSVNLFAVTSAGLSLFVIGGTLVGLPLHGMIHQVLPIALAKLVLHPLAVFLAALVLPLTGLPALNSSLRMAAVLLAAMPTMSIYPILAQSYGKEGLGATALLVTTVASFFSLSGLIWLIS